MNSIKKQNNFADSAAVLGIKDGVGGKARLMAADGDAARLYRGDGPDTPQEGEQGSHLTGVLGGIAAIGDSAAQIVSALSWINNKRSETIVQQDVNIKQSGSVSLDVNAKMWIGIAAAAAAVVIVALLLIFRKK